jgi:hypothetical protein
MKKLRVFCFCLALCALHACVTSPQSDQPQVLDKLRAMGVDQKTYAKIANHRVLGYDDIYELVKKSVPGPVIVTYLRSTHAPYRLTNRQLERLTDAGASGDLVNYLGQATGYFEATERNQTGRTGAWKNHPYYSDPFFMGPAPFGYEWPGEWDDPGWIGTVF